MPEREADKRRQRCLELQAQLDQWDKDLEDQEWCERLLENQDWKRLCQLYQESLKPLREKLEVIKKGLLEEPMTPETVVKVREGAMVMQSTLTASEEFVTFPSRELRRLREVQAQYPKVEKELADLKRRE